MNPEVRTETDARHVRQIERCAIASDIAREVWMTQLSRPISSRAEIRFFDVTAGSGLGVD